MTLTRVPAQIVEGRDCEEWMVVDGGNVVTHFFLPVLSISL